MSLNEIVKTMQDAVNRQTDQAKPGGYDTTATVRRIEGDTAFVHIPGGVDETPVKLTINAKAGDNVQVRVSGGNAFLVGNGSAPPTDDARANQAYTVATVAEGAAENALANAARAAEAADSAQASATRAESAAGDAVIAAGDAQTAACNAQTAADTALVSLSTVEDVVGVLNWITEHGTMTLTSDVTVNPAHVYFIIDPAGDYVIGGTHYSIVSDPKDAELSTYYELTVDESVQNYVATHIVVDSEGLWIIPDAGGNKVLIATGSGSTYTTAGTYIVGKVGGVDTVLASFTASGAQIGRNDGGNVSIDNNSVDINDGASQLATFGADGAQIGKDDENRLIITPIELLQKNSDGAVFFNVNTNNGTKTISVTLSGDSGSQSATIATSGSYTKTSEISIPSDLSPGTTVELSAMTGKLKPQYTGSEMVGWSFTFQNSTFNSTYREPNDAFINSNTLACFDVPSSSISVGTDLTNSYSCDFTVKYSGNTTIGLYHVSCVVSYSSANNKITSTWTVENNFSESRTISFQWSSLQGIFSYSTTVPYYVLGTSADAAVGAFSIVGGQSVYATSDNQASFGKFNVQDVNNDYAFIVGNGSDSANRSNALTVDWSGNVEAAGDVTDGSGFVLGKIPLANAALTSSTNMNFANGTWKNINAFTGYAKTNKYMDSDFFENNTNGFKVLKKGVYRITATCHFNAAGNGDSFGLRIYDNTASTYLGNYNYCFANGIAWSDVALENVATIDANHVIIPQFERYGGTQNWRPQTAEFTIQLIALA